MIKHLRAGWLVAILGVAGACADSPTGVSAPVVPPSSNAMLAVGSGWSIEKSVVDMQRECEPKGIEDGMTCMRPVGSTTETNPLAAGDTVWILYEVTAKAPTPSATARIIDDVVAQCQAQLGPGFGCSAWGFDIAGLRTGFEVPTFGSEGVYRFRFWLDIWNVSACVPGSFVNSATLVPTSPAGPTVTGSAAPVRINVVPAPGCQPPVTSVCTRTPGYWKQLQHRWPAAYDRYTTVAFFNGKTWQRVLDESKANGDMDLQLGSHYIAATLNLASLTPAELSKVKPEVHTAISRASQYFAGSLSMTRNQVEQTKDILDRFNNGREGVRACP
jgi:hypothetical protein